MNRIRLCDIRETPLDVAEVVAALDDDTAGGLTLFVGRVRDHDDGKGVAGLEYTAHPTAGERMREVCGQVASDFDVLGVAAVHRTGTLAIGDVAVVVATVVVEAGAVVAGVVAAGVVAAVASDPVCRGARRRR